MCFGGGGSYSGYGRKGFVSSSLFSLSLSLPPSSLLAKLTASFPSCPSALPLFSSFDRRFRIFDLSEYGERISTFKYTEKGEEIDLMDLLTPA